LLIEKRILIYFDFCLLLHYQEMAYTKQEKKEIRKEVYAYANKVHKLISEDDTISISYKIEYLSFLTAIKNAEFMIASKIYKQLDIRDDQIVDQVVFGKSDKINSEDVRISCAVIKNLLRLRKAIFKKAMITDAEIGYWKLSK
jgi:hypothetical protein